MAKHKSWWPKTREEIEAVRKAAASDDRDALAQLAVVHDYGVTDVGGNVLVRRNRGLARKYWTRAAELGDPGAITVLADNLTPIGHSARPLQQAERLYRRAFHLGSATAAENLAATYLNLGRYRDAVRWFRRAEAAGSPTATLELARAELYGLGTRRDGRAAFVKLERLARQRLGWNNWLRVEAMQLMADALMKGWLVRRDSARAQALYRQAAKLDPDDYYAAR